MEIGARVHHVQLLTPDVDASAAFYARMHGLQVRADGAMRLCADDGCGVLIAPGPANALGFIAFAFPSHEALRRFRQSAEAKLPLLPARTPLFEEDAFMAVDPDGNRTLFGVAADAGPVAHRARQPVQAHLQHCAIRSTDLEPLLAFYRDGLGFVVSDRVQDEQGVLRAGFLRTDRAHHALALFRAPKACLDHISFDAGDWNGLGGWADHLGRSAMPIVWGVGRHGPGNDAFLMVRDPDGNLVEVSCDMEVCEPDRPEGQWPHEERTLNLWGGALMRS